MKAYEAKSITYSTTIPANTTTSAIYTVPTGRTAKITYVYGNLSSTAVRLKINDSSATRSGSLPFGYDGMEDIINMGIYLSAGDALYIFNDYSSDADPDLYMCVIEEYDS